MNFPHRSLLYLIMVGRRKLLKNHTPRHFAGRNRMSHAAKPGTHQVKCWGSSLAENRTGTAIQTFVQLI